MISSLVVTCYNIFNYRLSNFILYIPIPMFAGYSQHFGERQNQINRKNNCNDNDMSVNEL